MHSPKSGLTAVEVLVSTLLASLLMVAMLSVLRGLKAQETALENRLPRKNWQQVLDTVLQRDLENSRTYELTSTAFILRGYAGRDTQSGNASWKPATILYELTSDGNRPWLTRREQSAVGSTSPRPEIVVADVTAIRVGLWADQESATSGVPPTTNQRETPITDRLAIQLFKTENGGPVYAYHFRQP